ncbi:DMT family transporter [Streptomyces roseirectus]|uniref:DMT family transporter n=2 Tax=Streptomyces roseirectus TaxID=2768066 RepID=A0A7H0IRW4_9ACTN|nr:DMT family transporter [Streptomyces roseirectus]
MLTLNMALWGSAFPLSKAAVEDVPHQVAALLRFGFGGLAMLTWLLATRGRISLGRGDLARAATAGALGVFGYNALFFWGLSLAPSIDGSIIVPVFAPVLTIAFTVLIQRERTSAARATGLALGIGGAVVFLLGVGGLADGDRLLGDLIYLAAAVSWSAYTLVSKRMLTGDPVQATALATLSGSVMLAVMALPAVPTVAWGSLSGNFWLVVAYLAIGPTAVAYVFYYRGVRAVGPATASVMMFLSPVFGAGGAVLFLDEGMSWTQGAGALLMLAGALLAVSGRWLPRLRKTTP